MLMPVYWRTCVFLLGAMLGPVCRAAGFSSRWLVRLIRDETLVTPRARRHGVDTRRLRRRVAGEPRHADARVLRHVGSVRGGGARAGMRRRWRLALPPAAPFPRRAVFHRRRRPLRSRLFPYATLFR